jgi:diacylglycerol kinase (ATP)
MNRSRICIVHNPIAGRPAASHQAADVAKCLVDAGASVDVVDTRGKGHAGHLAAKAVLEGYGMVVAAGGDGTVNEVIQALVGTDVIMGVIPSGTVNLWAREVGAPSTPSELARFLIDSPVRRVDVGSTGGRFFLLMAGIGLDAAVVEGVDPNLKKRAGRLAYAVSLGSLARGYRGTKVRISLDGRSRGCTALAIVIGNTRRYAGMMMATPHAIADDGMLDVTVVHGDNLLQGLSQVATMMAGVPSLRRRVFFGRAKLVEVHADVALPMQVDGDSAGVSSSRFESLPGALRVVASDRCGGLFGQASEGAQPLRVNAGEVSAGG